jgi:serine/threonine protein kinase
MTTGKPRRKPEDGPERPNHEASTRSVTPPGGVPPEGGTGAWVAEDASSRTGWVSGQAGPRWVDKTKSGEGWVEPAEETKAGKPNNSSPGGSSDETATFDEEQLAELATAGGGSKKRLGDYELERKIGQGGMGEVWIARQVSLDRPVAVKVLPRSLANQENFIERFQREAKAAASLMHPNVLQIYSFGVHEGTPYFAMEYIEGEDLQQRMRRQKRLEWEEISQIMIGVGNALAVAHDKGLIHRDIKPSNIMIDKNGIVKVMDFGLAKAMSGGSKNNLTSAGLIMGTPNYLSPEQGRGDPLDGRSDLYSLGIVLYELCTGQLPFRADTPAGLIFKHVYEPPPPPTDLNPDIPKFMVEIMMKLLEKDPDDRYKTAHEFNADMTEFLANSSHFVGGGERSDSGGYSDAKLAAKSGGFVPPVTAGTRKKQEQRNAVTEGVKRREVEEVQPTDEAEEASVAEAEPEQDAVPTRELPKFPSRHVPRNPPVAAPPARSKAPLVLLLLLVGGGAGLWFGKPELVRGWGEQLGLLQPAAIVTTGGVTVPTPPRTERVAYTLRPDTLQEGISAALLAPDQPRSLLKPSEEGVYATGEYRLELARLGYEPVSFPVRLARGDDGKGVIIGVDGNDPFGRDRAWAPTKALSDAYSSGRSSLSQKNYAAARAELQKAAALDPGFRPRLEDPTAKVLLDEAEEALARQQTTSVSTDTQLGVISQMIDKKDWRAAEEFLTALPADRKTGETQAMLERCKGEILRGDTIRASVEGAIERGAHGEAEKTLGELADADPRHPQLAVLGDRLDRARKQRQVAMSDMSQDGTAAAIGRLQSYLELVGKHDDEARRLLESLTARLSQERLLGEDVGKLEAAAAEKNWHEVRRLASKVLKEYPDNAAAQRLRSEAESQLSKSSIEEVLATLDQALVRGSLDDVVAVLDRDSPSFPAEREALAAMAEVQGKFTASEHREVQVTIEDRNAMVVATWEFGLQVLGEAPRTLLATHHVRLRRLEGGRWLVTELRVEGGIRAKQ